MLAKMAKTWLEVALNGPWGRTRQPGIPVRLADIVAEGIACAREGAAIVHVHAYDEASGRQRDSAECLQLARPSRDPAANSRQRRTCVLR